MAFRLRKSESVADGVRRIACEELQMAAAVLTDQSLKRDEAIHQVRKCCKRLRGLLRLVRPALGSQYRAENILFRDVSRKLSATRDADSVIEAVNRLLLACSSRSQTAACQEVLCELERRRSALNGSGTVSSRKLDRLAKWFSESISRIERWSFSRPGWKALSPGLLETYAKGRLVLDEVQEETADDEHLHELRKQVKNHWYHTRLLEGVWRPVMTTRAKALKDLSEFLGNDHDLVVLQEIISKDPAVFGEKRRVTRFSRLLREERQRLQREGLQLARLIYAEEPDALNRRLHTYWKVWHQR